MLLIVSSIILVPDVDSCIGNKLELSLGSLAKLAPTALVLRFDYEIPTNAVSIWNILILKGVALLNTLINSQHLVSSEAPKMHKGVLSLVTSFKIVP